MILLLKTTLLPMTHIGSASTYRLVYNVNMCPTYQTHYLAQAIQTTKDPTFE